MGDSTYVMQCFSNSSQHSQHQGDPLGSLGESVSFGRFMTETLEWEKWSTFNHNRYLEEAQRFSKPGLVAEKKALFEAHFKKIAANSDAKNEVRRHGVKNGTVGGPCMDLGSGKSNFCLSIDAAQSSTHSYSSFDQKQADSLMESQSREAHDHEKNDTTSEISEFVSGHNSQPAIYGRVDQPGSDMAADTPQDPELCNLSDILCDTRKCNYMVVETKSFKKFDPHDGFKTQVDELDQSEFVDDDSTMLLGICQENIAVQEPADQIVLASKKQTLTCPKTLASIRKPAALSHSKPRPVALPSKDTNHIQSMRAFGSGLLNKKRVISKSLHTSMNLDSGLADSKRPLAPKKLDRCTKYPTNSVSLRSSKEHSGQVATDFVSQKKLATSSKSSATIGKASSESYVRPAPPQVKKDKAITQRPRASVRNSDDMRKSLLKSLHSSINFDSYAGEKERSASSQKTETKSDATSARMPKTHLTHAPAKQVILDTATRRKQTIPVSNTSTFGRKLVTEFHTNSTPSLNKNENSAIQSNSTLTMSQFNVKKSSPKSLHMSVDLSSTVEVVRKPTVAQKSGSFNFKAPAARSYRDGSNQLPVSLRKSLQTSTVLQHDDKGSKRPTAKLDDTSNGIKTTEKWPFHPIEYRRPGTPVNLIKPPSPTVSTPFRFRSDERAAKRKEKVEEKNKVKDDNALQRKKEKKENDLRSLRHSINFPVKTTLRGGDRNQDFMNHELKLPPSRPQSPMYLRKQYQVKAQETANYRPPRTPGERKGGSHQVTQNKNQTSTASMTLLPRKIAHENASPNIQI